MMIPEPLAEPPTLEEELASAAAELDRLYESIRWHPMSSAPRDWTCFEAYDLNGAHFPFVFWDENNESFHNGVRGPIDSTLACWRDFHHPPSPDTLAFLTAKAEAADQSEKTVDEAIASRDRAEYIQREVGTSQEDGQ